MASDRTASSLMFRGVELISVAEAGEEEGGGSDEADESRHGDDDDRNDGGDGMRRSAAVVWVRTDAIRRRMGDGALSSN